MVDCTYKKEREDIDINLNSMNWIVYYLSIRDDHLCVKIRVE
jgi:hypothetical protein